VDKPADSDVGSGRIRRSHGACRKHGQKITTHFPWRQWRYRRGRSDRRWCTRTSRMHLSTLLVDKPADIDVETTLHPLRRKRFKVFG